MLNAINGSIQNELSRFFALDEAPVSLVNISTAAFCKARMKFSYSAFKALNRSLNETFTSHHLSGFGMDFDCWRLMRR